MAKQAHPMTAGKATDWAIQLVNALAFSFPLRYVSNPIIQLIRPSCFNSPLGEASLLDRTSGQLPVLCSESFKRLHKSFAVYRCTYVSLACLIVVHYISSGPPN